MQYVKPLYLVVTTDEWQTYGSHEFTAITSRKSLASTAYNKAVKWAKKVEEIGGGYYDVVLYTLPLNSVGVDNILHRVTKVKSLSGN